MELKEISFSKIYLYGCCPQAYLYEYSEEFRDLKKSLPDPPHLFFGEFLHAFLSRFWNKKTGKPFYRSQESFVNAGIGYFWQWASGKLKNRKPVKFSSGLEAKRYEEWAKKILRAFYLKNKDLPMPVEIEKTYVFEWEGFKIRARIDRVDEIQGRRIIVDYKLGTPDSEFLKLHQGLQFTIYSLAHEIKHGERVPIVWYSLASGKLFPTQRDEHDYERLYEVLCRFVEKIENDEFPEPNFDNPYCSDCKYAPLCAERYPDAWSRRKSEAVQLEFDLENPESTLIDTDPKSWIEVLYGEDFLPFLTEEKPIGPRRYAIFGENLDEVKNVLSLSEFSYWSGFIVQEEPGYVLIQSETRMPKKMRQRLQSKGLEVYEKIRETETIKLEKF